MCNLYTIAEPQNSFLYYTPPDYIFFLFQSGGVADLKISRQSPQLTNENNEILSCLVNRFQPTADSGASTRHGPIIFLRPFRQISCGCGKFFSLLFSSVNGFSLLPLFRRRGGFIFKTSLPPAFCVVLRQVSHQVSSTQPFY